MNCQWLKDYFRQCVDGIGVLPKASYNLCHSDKYKKCPFYMRKTYPEKVCKNINQCHFFNNFTMIDFDEFIELASKFCISKDFRKCKRYLKKENGEIVPIGLHLDGIIKSTIH